LIEKLLGEVRLDDRARGWDDNIKMDIRHRFFYYETVARGLVQWRALPSDVLMLKVSATGEFVTYYFGSKDLVEKDDYFRAGFG
jgi:hypothetical protein